MDLQRGTFVHWPIDGSWRANRLYLDLMLTVWRAWRFCQTPASQWSATDLSYKEWLDEGRPLIIEASRYEIWLKDHKNNDG